MPSRHAVPYESRDPLLADFARHVSKGKVDAFGQFGLDVVMGARSGIRFEDAFTDRSWINCHCNGGVFNLGHRNPEVVAALRDALERRDIGNHHLPSGARADLARRLAATTGGRLQGAVFGVSGGEAVDLALKLARGHTGRQTIVSASGGYHGHTGLAVAAGDPAFREPFGLRLPGFQQVPFDDLPALDGAIDDQTAAVILEPVPATLGMPIARDGYLTGVARLCRDRGALLIMDEVQTGLGRTGRFWCFQHEDLSPDMVVTGKGLSGGLYPMSATLVTAELLAFFDARPFIHISTFGGAELGCAAATRVLELTEAPGFLEHVRAMADRYREGFSGLPFELRQLGLMMGLSFGVPQAGLMAAKQLYDNGIFAVYAANDTSALQFLPPLIATEREVDEIVAIVRRTFA